MAKPSGLKRMLDAEFAKGALGGRMYEQYFSTDIMQIALGRMGWGAKRLREFAEVYSAAYEEYDKLRESDGKVDYDNWYFQETLDRELKRYVGDELVPYEQRHGMA